MPFAIAEEAQGSVQTGDPTTSNSWPMFRHDLNHTGYSTSTAPDTSNVLWSCTTGSAVGSSPAVAGGKVYVGSNDNKFYCLNASTGAHIWTYPTGGKVSSSPAVVDGKVYIGSYDRNVYCLDASTGNLIWNYTTGSIVLSSPAVVDGKVYVGSYDPKLYCLNASTGAHIWNYTTGFGVWSSPAVVDGKVYVGSNDNNVYCLNASTGNLIWSYTTGFCVSSSPAVVDGKVYIGSYDRNVYCLDASTGNLIWSYTTDEDVESSPAVVDGKVYVGSGYFGPGYGLYCLNVSTGNLIWSYTTGYHVESSPAVADGKVYVGSGDDNVYCLDVSTGNLIWSYTTGSSVSSSPAVVDGKVYIGSYDSKVYCFGSGYTLKVKTLDNSGNALTSCHVTVESVVSAAISDKSAISDNNGWANFSGLAIGTYVLTTRYAGNTVNQTTVIMSNATVIVYINCQVYNTSFYNSFKDHSGTNLYMLPSSFKLMCPNGTTTTDLPIGAYRLQNGTFTFQSITWQGSEVVPPTNNTFAPADGNPTANCMVYSLTVDPVFYDITGTALIQPSSWSIRFPNDTIRTVSSPVTYNQTQIGEYSIASIIWKGTEVIPETTPTTSLTSDKLWSPSINCLLPTSLSISLSSSTSYVGFHVEINGNLTCNEVGLSGFPILLSYSVTGGQSWYDITLVNTASDGGYSAVWMPSATGNYLVRANWDGNSTYPGTSTIINLAMTPYMGQNVFSVESNSTISALAFDTTNWTLSFTATGPNGTRGYTKVTVAKSLVANIANIRVYLDGNQLEYTITSTDDSWLLTFTYTHSTHEYAVDLDINIIPEFPSLTILPLLMIATLLAVIIYRRKHTMEC